MAIQSGKINALLGDWNYKDWQKISPVLDEMVKFKIRALEQKTISLLHVNEPAYWTELRSTNRIFLAELDHHHWTFSDSVFEKYVRRLASSGLNAVALFQSPYGYESPPVPMATFEKKLYQRAKMFVTIFRNESPKTTLLSPQIAVIAPDLRDAYLEFLVHNRSYFDVYALNCCYDYNEVTTAFLTGLLSEIISTAAKEVWVTRWSVGASNEPIRYGQIMPEKEFVPLLFTQAAAYLRSVFNNIENITNKRCKWFFTGVHVDRYHPDKKREESIWDDHPNLEGGRGPYWDFSDVSGLVTYDGKIKEPLLEALLQLVQNV